MDLAKAKTKTKSHILSFSFGFEINSFLLFMKINWQWERFCTFKVLLSNESFDLWFCFFSASYNIAGLERPSELKKATNSQKSLVHSAGFYVCQEK